MIIFITAIIVLIIDFITKSIVTTYMAIGESIPVWPSVFHLTYIVNHGAAFGILTGARWFFLAIVVVLLLLILYFRHRISVFPTPVKIGIGSLLGGALGNGYDRFVQGGVIDFFDFRIWPIFNMADIAICSGVVLLVWHLWHDDK